MGGSSQCLNYSPYPGLTFRDIAHDQQAVHDLIEKNKQSLTIVDTVAIWDQVINLFWDTIEIPVEIISGGLINNYGGQALQAQWQAYETFDKITFPTGLPMHLASLIGEAVHLLKDKTFRKILQEEILDCV